MMKLKHKLKHKNLVNFLQHTIIVIKLKLFLTLIFSDLKLNSLFPFIYFR